MVDRCSEEHSRKKGRIAIYLTRRMLLILWLGVSSGLPLALAGGTLQAWLKESGFSLESLGLFSILSAPYALKVLWAPFFDKHLPRPFPDRRRFWMLLSQSLLAASLLRFSFLNPAAHAWQTVVLTFLVVLLAASQDIAIDAYRTEVLNDEEFGAGAAFAVLGYRLGVLASGAGGLILAEYFGWHITYQLFAFLFVVSAVITLLSSPPDKADPSPAGGVQWLAPFKEFLGRSRAWMILAFVALYKIGDTLGASLLTAFLLEIGFTKVSIGTIANMFGGAATIAGALWGGYLLRPESMRRNLLLFGILQSVSTIGFVFLLWTGPSKFALASIVTFENISGGLGTAALTSYLMALCNRRFTAAQYAALTSVAALTRILIGSLSGVIVAGVGWFGLYAIGWLIAVPALVIMAACPGSLTPPRRSPPA